jgi:hypothetical protein
MYDQAQAQAQLEANLPDAPVQAWAQYHELFLFRVKFPMASEADYDPFFSVDSLTGEVRDFSVLTDSSLSEISNLDWKNV